MALCQPRVYGRCNPVVKTLSLVFIRIVNFYIIKNGGIRSLEINQQMSENAEIVREITIRTVLNQYGGFAVLGLILSIFTTPISLNENMRLFYNEDLMMEAKKIKEFLFFIFGSALIYFFLVNLYYKKMK